MSTPTKREVAAAAAAADKVRRKEVARRVAYKAPAESAQLIVELGQERLKALQTGGIALDNRTTQVAAIQLAAAAFAAGLTVSDKISLVGASLAALGCAVFVLGSSLAFWGMRSCENQVAGVDPTFWSGILTAPRFSNKLARSWAADITEDFIVAACAVDVERGRWLDHSLKAGAVGASFIILAVGANLLERWASPPAATYSSKPAAVPNSTTLQTATTAARRASPTVGPVLPAAQPPQPLPAASGRSEAPTPVKSQ